MHRTLPSILTSLLGSAAFCFSADTNAPGFRFHPELADMTNSIATPIVLTNSPLIGLSSLQVSNRFAQSFYWTTNNVARVDTGFRHLGPTDIWCRNLILGFAQDKVTRVEVRDQPCGCIYRTQKP